MKKRGLVFLIIASLAIGLFYGDFVSAAYCSDSDSTTQGSAVPSSALVLGSVRTCPSGNDLCSNNQATFTVDTCGTVTSRINEKYCQSSSNNVPGTTSLICNNAFSPSRPAMCVNGVITTADGVQRVSARCIGCGRESEGCCQGNIAGVEAGGCESGLTCTLGTCQCTNHASSACYGGDVYWYNGCGERQEIRTDCNANTQGCVNGACVAKSCTDTDNTNPSYPATHSSYTVAGSISGVVAGAGAFSLADFCNNDNTLLYEAACTSSGIQTMQAINCASAYGAGSYCNNGRCIVPTTNNPCSESDGGKVITVKGWVSDPDQESGAQKWDYCKDEDTVWEYYCSGGSWFRTDFGTDCSSTQICSDGECVSCGTIGNPCCSGQTCTSGTCQSGSCVSTGGGGGGGGCIDNDNTNQNPSASVPDPSYLQWSSIVQNSQSAFDTCTSGTRLTELYCTPSGSSSAINIDCQALYGGTCFAGACVPSGDPCDDDGICEAGETSINCPNDCTSGTTCDLDGVLDAGEECDCGGDDQECTAAQLGGESCTSLGHDDGDLRCSNSCAIIDDDCTDDGGDDDGWCTDTAFTYLLDGEPVAPTNCQELNLVYPDDANLRERLCNCALPGPSHPANNGRPGSTGTCGWDDNLNNCTFQEYDPSDNLCSMIYEGGGACTADMAFRNVIVRAINTDPNGPACDAGCNTGDTCSTQIPCPKNIDLPFFSIWSAILTVIVISVIYFVHEKREK